MDWPNEDWPAARRSIVLGHRRLLSLALGVALLGGACGSPNANVSTASASDGVGAPAYEPSTGFEPDAVRILTVTSIRISLEEYRAAHGAYPASLDVLFPTFAPRGQSGQVMASLPPASDGYTYVQTGATSYTLTVRLSNGQTYSVTAPEGP
jgi:hypothetical protein